MSELSNIANRLIEKGKAYIDVRIALFKLDAVEQNARIASSLITAVILGVVGTMFLLMLSIAAALWIGSMFEAYYCGFFIVAGFYLLLGLIVFIFRKTWIQRTVTDGIVDAFLDKEEQDED